MVQNQFQICNDDTDNSWLLTLYAASRISCFPREFHIAGTVITQSKSATLYPLGSADEWREENSFVFKNLRIMPITSTRKNSLPFTAVTVQFRPISCSWAFGTCRTKHRYIQSMMSIATVKCWYIALWVLDSQQPENCVTLRFETWHRRHSHLFLCKHRRFQSPITDFASMVLIICKLQIFAHRVYSDTLTPCPSAETRHVMHEITAYQENF